MTRKKEIRQASICQYQIAGTFEEQEAFKSAFVKGAEWADKTMIDKACKWITEHIDIPYEGEFIDDIPVDYVEYLSKRLKYAKTVADAFKQAMEE